MLQLIRYLKGYLIIKVWGFSPERFMNLCSNHDIVLWDIEKHGDFYSMCISLKGFYRLRAITRKTGTRVVITRRCGLPFLSVRMKRRKIFIAGLLGSLIFWIWMSGFIWAIEINGNYYVTEDIFTDFLEENGIEAGMKKKDVDIEALEKAIRTQFNIITWTSARIDGTRLSIQLKENDLILSGKEEEAEPPEGEGTDIVASRDGTIVSIITRSGVPLVSAGREVKKGETLVEGRIPIFNEDATVKKYEYCRSDADILLRCTYTLKDEINEKYDKKIYTDRERKRPFLMLGVRKLGLYLPGMNYQEYDIIEEKKQLCIFNNYYLPVYFGKDLVREYKTEEKIYSKDEIKNKFQEKIQKFIQTLEEKGVQIIEKNVTIKRNSGIWKMNTVFTVIESTGKEQATEVIRLEEELENQENQED